ncbi:MAG TPA: hypothetical protein VJ044_01290 [Candidatus Hodarchaeales archaeon]|nr:hypothetical protein [Candidatus Hodarchaeales archaeon]
MREMLTELWRNKLRLSATILTSFFIAFIPFYPDMFTSLQLWFQIVLVLLVVVLNVASSNFPDVISLALKNQRLEQEFGSLKGEFKAIAKSSQEELAELKDVIVSFVEHSHTYQDRILRLLKIHGEYLCIAKSSEGLSEVFNSLDPRPQLPFSKVLTQWPGAIKPFENMNLFLLPIKNLPGFSDERIKPWISQNIIPRVEIERTQFLRSIPRRIARKAEEFSYKYLAFVVRSDSLEFETRNRKFTKDLMDALLGSQGQANIARMTQHLAEIIRTKDFLNVVDWSAFVDLNNQQKNLFDKHRTKLFEQLERRNLHSLNDVSRSDLDSLKMLYLEAFGADITDRKSINLAQKTQAGVNRVLATLRKHGVSI